MNKAKREALEAKGWKLGDAKDFLGLTEDESRLVEQGLEEERRLAEIRSAVGRAFRDARVERKLTQSQVAKTLKTGQANVSKIESAADDVSLDKMLGGLFRLGGTASVVFAPAKPAKVATKRRRKPAG